LHTSYHKNYAAGSTLLDFVAMNLRPSRMVELCVKIGTAPTASDGETLDINIKVNGVAVMTTAYTIDENTAEDTMIRIVLPHNKS